MTFFTDNKKVVIFWTYIVLFLLLAATAIVVYFKDAGAEALWGVFLSWCGSLLVLVRDAAKEFGFDGKPD